MMRFCWAPKGLGGEGFVFPAQASAWGLVSAHDLRERLIALNIPAYGAGIKTLLRPGCTMESTKSTEKQAFSICCIRSRWTLWGLRSVVVGDRAVPGRGSHLVGMHLDMGQPSAPSVSTEAGACFPHFPSFLFGKCVRTVVSSPFHLGIPPIKESPELRSTSHSISFLIAKSEVQGSFTSTESLQTAYLLGSLKRQTI